MVTVITVPRWGQWGPSSKVGGSLLISRGGSILVSAEAPKYMGYIGADQPKREEPGRHSSRNTLSKMCSAAACLKGAYEASWSPALDRVLAEHL